MANADKDLIITPARNSAELDPYITFVGANTTTNAVINMFMYPESNGTISFEGSAGQLFSITNDLSGILYSINDADAVSQFNVSANGLNVLSANGGNTTVGTTTKTANLIVYGTLTASNISLPNTVATLNVSTANINSLSANNVSLNNVVISGNLTVSGTTTTINTQNLLANDAVIVLNSGQSTALNDTGWILQRFATPTISNYNVGYTWDEGSDRLIMGRTQNVGSETDIAYSNEWMTILGTNGYVGFGGNTNPVTTVTIDGAAYNALGITNSTSTGKKLFTFSVGNSGNYDDSGIIRFDGNVKLYFTSTSTNFLESSVGFFRYLNGSQSGNRIDLGASATNSIIINSFSGGVSLRTDSNTYPISFITNNIERMRVDGNGFIGIGTTTPTANLSVTGNTTISANLTVGGFVFASGSGLGIGTTSPTSAFDLRGTNRVASFFYNGVDNRGSMILQSANPTGSYEPRMIMYDGVGGNPKIIIGTNATSFFTQTNVAIGRETANSALHVLGNIEVSNVDSYIATSASAPISRPTITFDFARSRVVDPRITFIRATSAYGYDGKTYVRGDENLALFSKFEATGWSAVNSGTFTANNAVAPDGTTTAGTFTATVQYSAVVPSSATPTFTNGVQYTISVWARRGSGTNPISFFTNNGYSLGNTFSPTSTWARYTTTFTYSGVSGGYIWIQDRNTSGFTPVELWGLQIERRESVTEFVPTTNARVSRTIPQLILYGSNVPRFAYDPATAVCQGLLVEKSATNSWRASNNLANTDNWITTGISSYANTVIAPDGTLSATVFTEDTTTGGHYFLPSITNRGGTSSLVNQVVTSSIYLKAGTRRYVNFSTENSGVGFNVVVDTQTGTITNTANTLGGIYYSSSIQDVGGGWYRVSATGNVVSGSNVLIIVGGNTTATGPRSESYTGANNTIVAWGAQIESGFYPTSFIATTAAATVTRTAEYGTVFQQNTAPFFNYDEGTFFAELTKQNFAETGFVAGLGFDTNNYLGIGYNTNGFVYFQPQFSFIPGTIAAANNVFLKCAVTYRLNTASYTTTFSSGVNSATQLSNRGPMDGGNFFQPQIAIGHAHFGYGSSGTSTIIKKVAYYSERFSNEELRQITAY